MVYIIKCAVPILLSLINLILFRLSPKKRGGGIIALSVVLQSIILTAVNLFYASNVAFVALFFVLNAAIVYSVYRQKRGMSIALSVYETVALVIAFTIAREIGNNLPEAVNENTNLLLVSAIATVVYLLINIISYFSLRNLVSNLKSDISPLFFLFPICVAVLISFLFMLRGMVALSVTFDIMLTVATLLSLACVLLSFVLAQRNAKKQEEITALSEELAKQKLNKEWCGVVASQNELLRRLIHDEKNHLAVIARLSSQAEVLDYIRSLEVDIDDSYFRTNTNNKLLDILLEKYKHICSDEGISFVTNVKTANLSFVSDADLTSIVANILDNAIEASRKTDERKIHFELNKRGSFDVLICANSCVCHDKSGIISAPLPTSKEDVNFHGNGMSIIKSSAEKYGGEVTWSFDEKLGEFVTSIVFSKNFGNV